MLLTLVCAMRLFLVCLMDLETVVLLGQLLYATLFSELLIFSTAQSISDIKLNIIYKLN